MRNRSRSAFSPARFIQSLGFALNGILTLVKSEPNAKIHALASVVVIGLGYYLQLPVNEWLWIGLAIGMVWTAEAFNSAIESLTDLVTQENHPLAQRTKDLAAGAVLFVSITAAVIGIFIFGPKLL